MKVYSLFDMFDKK